MEIDPLDIVESAKTQVKDTRLSWLNPAVAITVALLVSDAGQVYLDHVTQWWNTFYDWAKGLFK